LSKFLENQIAGTVRKNHRIFESFNDQNSRLISALPSDLNQSPRITQNKNKNTKTTKNKKANMVSIDEMIREVLSMEIAGEFDFIELTEFSGYNPETIFKFVMEKCDSTKHRNNLQYMIFFGLLRGFGGKKKWSDLVERTSSATGKQMLTEAKNRFQIVMDKSKLTNVTIDRLMGAFPSLTFKAWKKICELGMGNSKVPHYQGSLPEKYRYPGSPAAMSTRVWSAQKENYLNWSLELQHIWRVENPNRENIEKFAELQYQTTLYPIASREN
jgi:hypothetical protein